MATSFDFDGATGAFADEGAPSGEQASAMTVAQAASGQGQAGAAPGISGDPKPIDVGQGVQGQGQGQDQGQGQGQENAQTPTAGIPPAGPVTVVAVDAATNAVKLPANASIDNMR